MRKRTTNMEIPQGWTDDLRIPLPAGKTVGELVDYVIGEALAGTTVDSIESGLLKGFGLSEDNAALARDRAFGGIFRAGTRSAANMPDPQKDPVAWTGYNRARENPSIIESIFPEFFGEKTKPKR